MTVGEYATKQKLVGRRIVDFKPGLFSDGRGGWAHDPIIVLDNGAELHFSAEETEDLDYGVAIFYKPPARKEKANGPLREGG